MAKQWSQSEATNSEWVALELICLGLEDEENKRRFAEIVVAGDLHWGELIEQAVRHKLLPMLARHVLTPELYEFVPPLVEEHLGRCLDLNRYKTEVYRDEALRMAEMFAENQVRFAATKGIVFESLLYGGNGGRSLRDIDFFVHPDDRSAAIECMERLGYSFGDFDEVKGGVVPLTREELMKYKLDRDHIPQYVKDLGNPVVPCVIVDISNSLTWDTSEYHIPPDVALAAVDYIDVPGRESGQLPMLDFGYQFLYTCLHLFREAWVKNMLPTGSDVNLIKFTDIMKLWEWGRARGEIQKLKTAVEEFGLAEPVLWVFTHLDRTFGSSTASEIAMNSPIEEGFLASGGKLGGGSRKWRGSMRERLRSKNRQVLFEE